MILIGGKARFLFSLPFPPSSNIWNDMQWYSYSCKPWIGIGGIRSEWICVGCWICVGYVWDTFGMDMCGICVGCWICVGYVWDTFGMDMCGICVVCWICVGYVWDTFGMDMCGICVVCWICVGYVWNGYVWDMCGVLDMCGICVVWDTPTIFWRTLRRNVFRENKLLQSKFQHLSIYIYIYLYTVHPCYLCHCVTGRSICRFVSPHTCRMWVKFALRFPSHVLRTTANCMCQNCIFQVVASNKQTNPYI